MKRFTRTTGILTIFAAAACSAVHITTGAREAGQRPKAGTVAVEPVTLPFDTYSGYFVSNTFEPDAAASFVIIDGQKRFGQVFGVAFVMRDTSHRLPKDAFQTNAVLAVVKRGKAVWTFTVDGVAREDRTVVLRYTAAAAESDSATFACPLIVSIPRGDYTSVTFVENGKQVRSLIVGTEAR